MLTQKGMRVAALSGITQGAPEELDEEKSTKHHEAESYVGCIAEGQLDLAAAVTEGHERRRKAGDVGTGEGINSHGCQPGCGVNVCALPVSRISTSEMCSKLALFYR